MTADEAIRVGLRLLAAIGIILGIYLLLVGACVLALRVRRWERFR